MTVAQRYLSIFLNKPAQVTGILGILRFKTKMTSAMIIAPAAERNKQPLLSVLKKFLDSERKMFALEVASGTGQHVAFFGEHFPNITWQPSDIDTGYFCSVIAHTQHTGISNVREPIYLDISQPIHMQEGEATLTNNSCDVILCTNMIHISPLECTIGLFNAAGQLLKQGGMLITYGPYAQDGVLTPESNVRFDQSLRKSDSRHGIRDIRDLKEYAKQNGLTLEAINDMPANNKTLIFRKSGEK